MTTSQLARSVGSVRVEAKPSCPTSPAMTRSRREVSRVEAVAELGPQAIEAVVAQDLPLQAVGGAGPPAGPDEDGDLAVGDGSEQPLDQRRAEKAGGASHCDALALRASPITAPL